MIAIEHPASCLSEREYIFHVLLHEFLGLQYTTRITETQDVVISSGGKSLMINDSFFPLAEANWLQSESLPPQPLSLWDSNSVELNVNLVDAIVPVIYGTPVIKAEENICNIGIDIFGSAFFMLSRYEEAVKTDRDQCDRFPATTSLSFQEGFLDRPIVDEYVEILWATMQQLWPGLKRKKREFTSVPTHDVDHPYLYPEIKGVLKGLRRIGGDILHRHSAKTAIKTAIGWSSYQYNCDKALENDPFNTFKWIMEYSERAGVKSCFNFMTHCEDVLYGGNYDINDNIVVPLLKNIIERGHDIGFHPTKNSYTDEGDFAEQAGKFFLVVNKLKTHPNIFGGRQHYLRWEQKTTPYFWSKYGFQYDSSLGYADHAGFRCGTCHSYFLWDLNKSERLSVKEYPLILMEGTLISKQYMSCSFDEAKGQIKKLRRACKSVSGNFVFLWHNSELFQENMRKLYYACLSD